MFDWAQRKSAVPGDAVTLAKLVLLVNDWNLRGEAKGRAEDMINWAATSDDNREQIGWDVAGYFGY